MIDPSAVSMAATTFRDHLKEKLEFQDTILIGHPAVTSEMLTTTTSGHYLSLFFFHIDYSGYPAGASKDDPIYVKLHCLITPYCREGQADENGVKPSLGEMDLRLLGRVVDVVHKNPLLDILDGSEHPVAQLQVVPLQITLDDINKIWSTQGNTTPYRPSIAFELSLLPVPLEKSAKRQPRVASVGLEIVSDTKIEPLPDQGFRIPTESPSVPLIEVDPRRPDWKPHICLVDDNCVAHYTLTFAENEFPPKLQISGAGDPGSSVKLFFEKWDRTAGWRQIDEQQLTLDTTRIDPLKVDSFVQFDWPEKESGQYTIYAERLWKREGQNDLVRKSNLLVISVIDEVGP